MTPTVLADLPSPALLFKPAAIDFNIDLMLKLAGGADRLRPHVKTHKCPQIIRRQVEKGICKFKCATIAEAELVAQNGGLSVVLAKQPVGPDIARLFQLIIRYPQVEFETIVDHPAPLRELASASEAHPQALGLYVDVDCGMGRTGIAVGEGLSQLYQELEAIPHIRTAGFHVYDGHLHDRDPEQRQRRCKEAIAPVLAMKERLEQNHLPVPKIIAGGSPTFPIHAANPEINECSPGTTLLWDSGYGDRFDDLPFQPAAFLLTRVISRLSDHSVCTDLGHKAVSADKPQPRARFDAIPDAALGLHSEEHLVLCSPLCASLQPGDHLIGIPAHVCPTVALHDEAYVISEDDRVTDRWPIAARARRLNV